MPYQMFELIRKAQQGDISARNQILLSCGKIIENVLIRLNHVPVDNSAKRYGALIGILSAIRNFNFSGQFASYAAVCAYRQAQREISMTEHLVYHPLAKLDEGLRKKEMVYQREYIDAEPHSIEFIRKTTQNFEPEASDPKMLVDNFLEEVQLTPVEKDAIEYTSGTQTMCLREYGKKHNMTSEGFRINQKRVFKKFRHFLLKKGIKKEHIKY